ncbi:MAG: hypothetical protein ACRDAQ_01975 [Cetobacterium sp.]
MLLDDMLDIYTKTELGFQDILEMKNELKKISEKYSNQKKTLIEYLVKYNSAKMISENSTRLFGEIEALKKCLNDNKFENSTYQRQLTNFEFKCIGLENNTKLFFDYKPLVKSGENFFKKVEDYYQEDKNPFKAYIMIEFLDGFINEIEIIDIELKSLDSINKFLESENKRTLNSTEKVFELKLFSELSLNEIIAALLIIRNMYNQIKDFLEVEEEIEIIKIETGSLFCKLLGNTVIIGMISGMLAYVAKDVYNSSLNPLKAKEVRTEELRKLLDLETQLKESGRNIEGIGKKIDELNDLLFDASEMLVKSTTKIKINDEIFEMELTKRKEIKLSLEKFKLDFQGENNGKILD